MINLNNKRLVVVTAIAAIVIIVSIIMVLFARQTDKQIIIKNYDEYAKLLPQDRRDAINKALYNIVKSNANDAAIRKDSYTETYDDSNKIYSSTFIVDIASVKQSYKIIFTWSKDNNFVLKGDNLRFDCLTQDQLIYGDFNCSEVLNIPKISNDPVLDYLPYSNFHYTITLNDSTGNKVELDARIFIYSSDTRGSSKEQAVKKYKAEIASWFTSKGLDINNYIINYTVD